MEESPTIDVSSALLAQKIKYYADFDGGTRLLDTKDKYYRTTQAIRDAFVASATKTLWVLVKGDEIVEVIVDAAQIDNPVLITIEQAGKSDRGFGALAKAGSEKYFLPAVNRTVEQDLAGISFGSQHSLILGDVGGSLVIKGFAGA